MLALICKERMLSFQICRVDASRGRGKPHSRGSAAKYTVWYARRGSHGLARRFLHVSRLTQDFATSHCTKRRATGETLAAQ